jgi:hypothetical protein
MLHQIESTSTASMQQVSPASQPELSASLAARIDDKSMSRRSALSTEAIG